MIVTGKPIKEKYGLIEFCLKFPYTDKSSKYGTPISVAIATITIPFILPMFLLSGYLAQVRRAAYYGEEVPKLEFYGELIDEGKGAVISQLPVLFIGMLGIVGYSLIQTPFFFSFLFGAFFLSPVVAMQYALEKDYKSVYNRDFANIVSSSEYVKYYFIYSLLVIFMVTTTIVVGSGTIGIGFVLLLPTVVVSRAAYWGYVYEKVEMDAEEPTIDEGEG